MLMLLNTHMRAKEISSAENATVLQGITLVLETVAATFALFHSKYKAPFCLASNLSYHLGLFEKVKQTEKRTSYINKYRRNQMIK